jgi:hypothetical protein
VFSCKVIGIFEIEALTLDGTSESSGLMQLQREKRGIKKTPPPKRKVESLDLVYGVNEAVR